MKKTSRTIAIIVLVAWFLGAFMGATAQNVILKGNVFEQVEKKDTAIKTSFVYKDRKGKLILFASLKRLVRNIRDTCRK